MNIVNKLKIRFATPKRRAELVKKCCDIQLGEHCEIHRNVNFGSEPYLISIGDHVRITNNVQFITHDGGIWVLRYLEKYKMENADIVGGIRIGNNVHIGVNTIIMPNVCIGNNVIIGCSSVVTKNVPDNTNTIVARVPAREIKSIDDYYKKHKDTVYYTKNISGEEKKNFLMEKIMQGGNND